MAPINFFDLDDFSGYRGWNYMSHTVFLQYEKSCISCCWAEYTKL